MGGRRVVIVRHGERVDFTFSDEWINTCFSDDNTDTYVRQNLNMPDTVPKRHSPQAFLRDCPLTKIGEHVAFITGQSLAEDKILKEDFEVFVSPALRCVQTATGLLKGIKPSIPPMKMETGLFEWTGWFRDFMPQWMSVEEYRENGYNVHDSYTPLINSLQQNESLDEHYERSHNLIQHLINSTDKNKDLLLVAHGLSLDSLTRQLLGGKPRTNPNEMMSIVTRVAYCGVAVIEQNEETKEWSLVSLPQLKFRHANNSDFDATVVLSSDVDPDGVILDMQDQNQNLHT